MSHLVTAALGLRMHPGALVIAVTAVSVALFASAWGSPALAADQISRSADNSDDDSRYRVEGTEGDGLRMRKEPGLDTKIVAYLPEGAIVRQRDDKPVDEDGERWLPVRTTEGKGWVSARYLKQVKDLATTLPTLPKDASFADRVVTLARSQTGQPYVWAGNAPGGFDCSGFVQWVYTKAGLPMERLIEDQLAMGKKVDRDSLKPGDLIAFVDTYTSGVSHVGVYLGNNLFEHASDEVHGVTVSRLTETYWADRYYKAVRFR